jgi:receptor-binding and translocation channel-forming TcA subunit of Tc toxin
VATSLSYVIPQTGSSPSLNYGGRQLGDALGAFGTTFDAFARILEPEAESSSITANFKRREEEWNQQLILAQQELKQMYKQVLASDIRVKIAEKEIDIHNKNIEQTNELDEFYKNKFTNLGLYNYLSTSMFRLYREAYNLVYDMALKAEEPYKFEHDDNTAFFIL